MTDEHVILVNERDEQVGTIEKMKAHELGYLHRAISVFVFNLNGELLLQRRAFHKYHSGGLWSNTCCSHPRPGETVSAAAVRRLREEMGMSCELIPKFSFIYRVVFDNLLTEHEFDHCLFGFTNHLPVINKEEVAEYRYISMPDLKADLIKNPNDYTEWFKIIIEKGFIEEHLPLSL